MQYQTFHDREIFSSNLNHIHPYNRWDPEEWEVYFPAHCRLMFSQCHSTVSHYRFVKDRSSILIVNQNTKNFAFIWSFSSNLVVFWLGTLGWTMTNERKSPPMIKPEKNKPHGLFKVNYKIVRNHSPMDDGKEYKWKDSSSKYKNIK